MEKSHLNKLLGAIADFMDKPKRGIYAIMDLAEAIEKHGFKAMNEYDELMDYCSELEAEIAQYRREEQIQGGDAA